MTTRQQTGTQVSVPIPEVVAQELLTELNGNPTYVFWTGNGMEDPFGFNASGRGMKVALRT